MLRQEHPVFQSPIQIDFSKTVTIDVPDAWAGKFDGENVRVLPLVKDSEGRHDDGWCTYTDEHLQAPELEIICGGINAKTPKASAIWRQGNLVHFGFEQSPHEMNEAGNALLVNTIDYASRLQDNRAIIRRSEQGRLLDRDVIKRLLANEKRSLKTYLEWYFSKGKLLDELTEMSRDELRAWLPEHYSFLAADHRGKFFVDKEAQEFGVAPMSPEFIPAAIESLGDDSGERSKLAQALLDRYVPMLESSAPPREWQTWWEANQDYLFFSDSGGYRWYVDSFAKLRNVPTSDLRGAARANL